MPINSLAKSASQETETEQHPGSEMADALMADKLDQTHIPGLGNSVVNGKVLSAELAQTWLSWQCRMVAGIISGALYLPADVANKGSAIAIWPSESKGESQLMAAATQALMENRGLVRPLQRYGPDSKRACDVIACPLLVDDVPVAIVSVMISPRSASQQQAVLQLLQWGGLWMQTLINRQQLAQREARALKAMTGIFKHSSCHAAAMEAVNQLADQFGCERASIGFRRGLPIRLQALSHVSNFDPRSQLVRRIEAVMEEAVDQNITMTYPGNPDQVPTITRAHAELLEQQADAAICSIPLPGLAGPIGAITLERDGNQPFDKDTLAVCQSLANFIGPALELKQLEEGSFWSKNIKSLREFAADLFGPKRLKLKLLMLSVAALLLGLSFIEGRYEIAAPASIEGAVRQALVAPHNGYVKQAAVRAGDLVKKGQLIALLDDRNLQLERQKWQSQHNKIETEYQEALAKRERAALSVLRAQLDQVDAEIRLIEEKIIRTQLYAPFDGMVVSGDLSQSLGAPVETGQVLYEVAPLDSYRVVLEVDEHDVAGLDRGKTGHLIISALPRTSFAIVVDQVVPVAVSSETRNFFRVEASLDESAPLLRPGMRGVAKVDMGQHNLLWIWTHSVIDRIRLWIWSAGW